MPRAGFSASQALAAGSKEAARLLPASPRASVPAVHELCCSQSGKKAKSALIHDMKAGRPTVLTT